MEATAKNKMEEKMLASNSMLFKAWNEGDMDSVKKTTVKNYKYFSNGKISANNQTEYEECIKFFRTAISDFKLTYDVMTVDGNKTYTKWIATGTNDGPFGEQPATGKSSTTHGFTIITYNDEGKAMHEETYFDQLSFLEEWGYVLNPPKSQ